MARIRTIKPEAFASESLAAVSLSAERTFFGLLTQADDKGRIRDQAAVIARQLWSLRREHGPVEVEDDLTQLGAAESICRYEGEDGRQYLHVVAFTLHQKINRPSISRIPSCPHHDLGVPRESSLPVHGAVTEASRTGQAAGREPAMSRESAGQGQFSEPSQPVEGGLNEPDVSPQGPDLGPRNRDLGTTPLGGASAAPAPQTVSAKHLITEYAAACEHRPPASVLGQLEQEAKKLLDEGIAPTHVRAGLDRHRAKGLHPKTLPSVVHEVMNAGASTPTAAHRPWTNPTDVAAAYGGAL
ncbi:hypothetical protein ACFXGI_35085 [Streptomyces sp. NPDC059355]|uniref:hypothetical protein n=1 Tax=Streptomyces sp. NPDC059355 TaxID=3346811 RepID=UPI0036966627